MAYRDTIEIYLENYENGRRRAFGATLEIEVTYEFYESLEVNTPLGPKYIQEVNLVDTDATLYAYDKWGGELYYETVNAFDYVSKAEILDQLERGYYETINSK